MTLKASLVGEVLFLEYGSLSQSLNILRSLNQVAYLPDKTCHNVYLSDFGNS